MTGPEDTGRRLAAVAAWDVSLLRAAVATLAAVAARLQLWRMRLDAVGRTLESAQCWSGPAAQSAAGAVLEISAVAAAVDAALGSSSTAFGRMAGQAALAQELAVEALARQAARPVPGAGTGQGSDAMDDVLRALVPEARAPALSPAAAVTLAALEHADAASRAAEAAGDALTRVTVGHLVAPATFGDLVGRIGVAGPARTPAVPRLRAPARVAAWWSGLSAVAQRAVILAAPAEVGSLDGVPAWARDRANRLVLERTLGDRSTPPYIAFTARVVAECIRAEEDAGRRVQLQALDLLADRVVLSLGDLDTAAAVAVLVPGIGNTPGDDLDALAASATAVSEAAEAAAPDLTVAAVVWLGYRPPSGPQGLAPRAAARRGGAALDDTLDGLAAARLASGRARPRTTVLAHSYGTVVVDEAADSPGPLAADALVLLGSPGMRGNAAALEAPQVYDAAAAGDPVAQLGWFGTLTWLPGYGATELPADPSMGHSDYYDPAWPTLAAMGEVVAGRRGRA